MKNKPAESEILTATIQHLKSDNASQLCIDTFCERLARYNAHPEMVVSGADITPPDAITDAENLPHLKQAPDQLLRQTVVFKLNGGLGTSMGLSQAKSLIPVKDGLTFLDIIIRQMLALRKTAGDSVPLILMNSFSTESDTLKAIEKVPAFSAGQGGLSATFLQNRVPKLDRETLHPASFPANPELTWCPPGHGDFYTSLVSSGLLDQLLAAGFRYAFISNSDNLGATLDYQLLHHFATTASPFMMEVTDRTAADRKGGHLARSKDGRLMLRESAQCPADESADFQNIDKYRFFNTNNLWVNLERLAERLATCQNILPLPIIANRKTVNPRDPDSQPVVQLETAMGAAIELFPDSTAVRVPRTRFAPVKTTNDLLALRSDLFHLTDQFHISANPARTLGTITIDLAPQYYKLIDQFEARFAHGIPSLLHCEELIIQGDYSFEQGVSLSGRVTLPETATPVVIDKKTYNAR